MVLKGEIGMSLFKILGGVAIGVGAVAAAPFTGGGSLLGGVTLIGSLTGASVLATAATAAAATTAGIAGGVIAAQISDSDKKKGYTEGRTQAIAEQQIKMDKLRLALENAISQINDSKEYFKLIIALSAVGMATAYADGHISQDEIDDLDAFVSGEACSAIPTDIKCIIDGFKTNPPSFNQAIDYVKKLQKIDWDMFENVIAVVSASDGNTSEEELAFLEAFRIAKAA